MRRTDIRRGQDEIEANVNDNKNDKKKMKAMKTTTKKKEKRETLLRKTKLRNLAQPSVIGMVSQRKVERAGARCNVAREDCFVNLGYTLSCGVSSNKMLAKLTSGMNKPNCCTILEESFTPSLLENLPIDRIRGLGGIRRRAFR